jgi:ectonucleotide pyrophosphatase/phosphodiesterase family protein 7
MHWFAKEDFDFVTLYYGESDTMEHLFRPETESRKVMIQQGDRAIG